MSSFQLTACLVCVLALSLQATAVSECPAGYTEINRKCYMAVNDMLSWIDAQQNCRRSGGHLAPIFDAKDTSNVQLMRIKFKENCEIIKIVRVWMGGMRCEGKVSWFGKAPSANFRPQDCNLPTPICEQTYSHWYSHQPDNNLGKEMCIDAWGDAFEWNDMDCNWKRCSLCQIDMD